MSLISEFNQARAYHMNDQQLGETPCSRSVCLHLPEQATAEVFTTTIDNNKPESGFDGFGFSEALLKTLAAKGYSEPSPIQKAAFPELMLGRDLVGQAQTGTGKTAAFALPLLERLAVARRRRRLVLASPANWRCRWPTRSRPIRLGIRT